MLLHIGPELGVEHPATLDVEPQIGLVEEGDGAPGRKPYDGLEHGLLSGRVLRVLLVQIKVEPFRELERMCHIEGGPACLADLQEPAPPPVPWQRHVGTHEYDPVHHLRIVEGRGVEHREAAAVRLVLAGDGAQQRGLAGPVGPDECVDTDIRNREGEIGEHGCLPVADGDIDCVDGCVVVVVHE